MSSASGKCCGTGTANEIATGSGSRHSVFLSSCIRLRAEDLFGKKIEKSKNTKECVLFRIFAGGFLSKLSGSVSKFLQNAGKFSEIFKMQGSFTNFSFHEMCDTCVTSSKRCKISFKKQKVCESIWPTLQIFEIKERDRKRHTQHTQILDSGE